MGHPVLINCLLSSQVDDMRPLNPEGEMPRAFPDIADISSGSVEFSHENWGWQYLDKLYPNRSIDFTLKSW